METLLQQRQQKMSDEALAGPLNAAGTEEEEIPLPSLPFHVVKELSAFLRANPQTQGLPNFSSLSLPFRINFDGAWPDSIPVFVYDRFPPTLHP